jgi:hypothetical protein
VERGLHELHREEKAPLALASVEYLWPIYRTANKYPHLVEHGVSGNPDRLNAQELHNKAWAVVRPSFEKDRENAAALYAQLAGTGRTTNDLVQALAAASQGKVEILLIARDTERWGTFDATTGRVTVHDRQLAGDEDLVNLAALETLRHGGAVYAVEAQSLPAGNTLAAIFWLPKARKENRI